MDRRAFVAGSVALFAAPLVARAHPAAKVWRIGLLWSTVAPAPGKPYPAVVEPSLEALRDWGWVEGQNVAFVNRWGPDLQIFASELVGLKVDLIVALSVHPALAAKAATRTTPIVFAANDAVELGLVASLARPGGNLTGMDWRDIDWAWSQKPEGVVSTSCRTNLRKWRCCYAP
jgi:putative ABC transport system substrate-binding protein